MPDPRKSSADAGDDRPPKDVPPPSEEPRDRKAERKGQDTEGGSTAPSADMYRDIPGDRVGG